MLLPNLEFTPTVARTQGQFPYYVFEALIPSLTYT